MENEDRKIAKVNSFLADLDKQLETMIMNIEKEKDIADARTGSTGATIDTRAVSEFVDTINAIHIDGDDKVLAAISGKYDKAIELLNTEINKENNQQYKAQMEKELNRLQDNKSVRFDPIAETYKELVSRLEKGEVQQDYYQNKADEKAAEIKTKEYEYKFKNGNIDLVLAKLQEPISKLKAKTEIKEKYEELKKINADIEKIEGELKATGLSEEDKKKKEEELKSLTEKRKALVNEFEKTATDKDGNKYKRADGKTDKEYIESLDESKIEEAINEMAKGVKDTISNMPMQDRRITILGKDMKEKGRAIDLANQPDLDTVEGIDKFVELLKQQKALWNDKVKENGYDKVKLQQEFENYSKQAQGQPIEQSSIALADTKTSFGDRFNYNRKQNGIIKSFFKSLFNKKETESAMRQEYARNYEELSKEETKKHALEYLEKNRNSLNKLDERSKKSDAKAYRDSMRYNVNVTQAEINKFWDKKREEAQRDEGREP